MSETSSKTEIRVIGAKNSGKTTYLATLACCPRGLQERYPGLQVTPGNNDTKKLAESAEDILKNGAKLAATWYDPDLLHDVPYYNFIIEIPANKKRGKIQLELTTRDFPGEFFQEIPQPSKQKKIATWIDDLFTTKGWMVMMTDWDPKQDLYLYKPAFSKLCEEIKERERDNPEIQNLRIAVVMAKCERGELWPCRLDPDQDLFEVRLPKTYELLTKNFSSNRLQFFACSAFGVLRDRRQDFDPRPNCSLPDDGSPEEVGGFLRNPSSWYPYGLIPPLYWLATGIRIEE